MTGDPKFKGTLDGNPRIFLRDIAFPEKINPLIRWYYDSLKYTLGHELIHAAGQHRVDLPWYRFGIGHDLLYYEPYNKIMSDCGCT